MSALSSDDMMKLMAYADGELEGAERAEVETLLATDETALRFVEQVAGLGDIVKERHASRDAKAIATFDVADAIMAKVEQTAQPAAGARSEGGAKVVSLADARARRNTVVGGVLAAVAVAASIFLFTRPEEAPMGQGGAPAKMAANPATPAPAADPSEPGVEVSAVESPGNTVSVFYLPSGNELTTSVVVWVDETGEK